MGRFLNRHLKSGLVPEWIIQKLAQAPDKQKASTEIFADIVKGLKNLCQGIHIITIGGEEKLKYYLDAAKLKYRITSYNVCYTKLLRSAKPVDAGVFAEVAEKKFVQGMASQLHLYHRSQFRPETCLPFAKLARLQIRFRNLHPFYGGLFFEVGKR